MFINLTKPTRSFRFMLGITWWSLKALTSHGYWWEQVWVRTLLQESTISRLSIWTVVVLSTVRWVWLQRFGVGPTETVNVSCNNKYNYTGQNLNIHIVLTHSINFKWKPIKLWGQFFIRQTDRQTETYKPSKLCLQGVKQLFTSFIC